jgi:hypothetical protein
MDGIPTPKPSGELTRLQRIQLADIESGKFYFMRVRNKDSGPDAWGFKKDYIVKINKKDNVGVSAFTYYERSGEPRDGVPHWEKVDDMILIPTDAITKRNMNDNTTFYIKENQKVKKTLRSKKRVLNRFRKFLGFTRRRRQG